MNLYFLVMRLRTSTSDITCTITVLSKAAFYVGHFSAIPVIFLSMGSE